jgi:hypothetical protein
VATLEPEAVKLPAIQSAVQLDGIDHVEPCVGNGCQAAHFHRSMLGFRPVARVGLETGVRDRLPIATSAWCSPAGWTPTRRSPRTRRCTATA